jgi:hypothetical protein
MLFQTVAGLVYAYRLPAEEPPAVRGLQLMLKRARWFSPWQRSLQQSYVLALAAKRSSCRRDATEMDNVPLEDRLQSSPLGVVQPPFLDVRKTRDGSVVQCRSPYPNSLSDRDAFRFLISTDNRDRLLNCKSPLLTGKGGPRVLPY